MTGKGREIAEALAKKLAAITPRAADDEAAGLAPFVDPSVAERVSALIDKDLEIQPGVEDVSAKVRGTAASRRGRVPPTCCRRCCWRTASIRSPTASTCSRSSAWWKCQRTRCPTASATRWSSPPSPTTPTLIERLVASPLVDRLNIGALPTTRIGWDQPHEGNLFEHLYARRAIQRVA